MNSSGIKRGLATTAVAALAVTGLPFLAGSASATPITADYPADGTVTAGDIEILNPDTTPTPSEATTSAYRVVVAASTDVVAIQVRYTPTGGTESIVATRVERVNGAFTTTINPTQPGTLTVQAFNAAGDLVPAALQTQAIDVNLPGLSDTASIGGDVNLGVWNSKATAAGANDFTVGINGTTSLTDTASPLDDGYRVVLDARTGVTAASTANADVTGATSGAFAGVLPLNGYAFTPGGPDQIVVGAEPQDATGGVDGARANVEDAAVKTLYLQQLGSVTAVAANGNLGPGETTNVTVTVADTTTKPIAGADVYKSVSGGAATLVGQTNAAGQLVDNNGGAGLGTGSYKYFVNAPAGAIDNPQVTEESALGDKSSTVAIAVYTPVLTSITVKSVYGTASDMDEVDPGTPYIAKAVDQNGNGIGGEQLYYTWTVDPFDPAGATVTTNEITAGSTTDNTPGATTKGEVALRFANTTDFTTPPATLPSGTWTLKVYRKSVGGAGAFNGAPVDYKVGEAEVTWTPADVQAALAGSTTVKGSLELEDGTALGSIDRADTDPLGDVNRTANLLYAAGDEDNPATPVVETLPGDSRIAPITEQDTTVTTVAVGGLTGAVKFNAAGVANVKVNDANPETFEEIDANLQATTSGALGVDGVSDVDVDFLATVVADAIIVNGASNYFGALGFATPGRPATIQFKVTNASGQTLSNKDVAITVGGGGFITDNPALVPTTAQLNGVWANKGTTATVKTDGNGIATVTVALEKNTGLDDDFRHDVTVAASVDGKSVTKTETFRAQDAVNLDRVEITPAEDNTASLPDAQVDFETVDFDVFAFDQFGNLSDETFNADDAGNPRADVTTTGDTQSTLDPAAITASADSATNQIISVSVTDLNGAAADGVVTDTADAINWYVVDFAASSFTLQQQGAERVPAGTRVTEVLTVLDQKGNPVQGLVADFIRSGPSDEDSDQNGTDNTDATGKAFYDFTGGSAGTARISAVVETAGGTRVGTADDTVTFTGVIQPENPTIVAKLGGNSKGAFDRLRVSAPARAQGAVVRLFKVVAGKRIQVGNTRGLNANGQVIFSVVDRNGKKLTKYVAVVRKTAVTRSDTTNPKSLR